jgi:hypothetical protein
VRALCDRLTATHTLDEIADLIGCDTATLRAWRADKGQRPKVRAYLRRLEELEKEGEAPCN